MTSTSALPNAVPFVKGYDKRREGNGPKRIVTPEGERVTLAELARKATYEAVTTLRRCVNDDRHDIGVRCRAAGYLLQLGWGAAPKEATLRLVSNDTLAGLSEAELIAHVVERLRGLPEPVTIEGEIERDA